MTNSNTNHRPTPSVLASLRNLVPDRLLQQHEALHIAELQAARLRELTNSTDTALAEEAIASLPRIRVVRRHLPTSGMSYWNGECWVIALNENEPEARQRFTLVHEYKHILDHPTADRLYRDGYRMTASEQAERAADYFAGCVLMPRMLLKRSWGTGVQTLSALARTFEVSSRAVEVRLSQIGLTEPTARCTPPRRIGPPKRGVFYRDVHPAYAVEEVAG